MLNGMLVLLVTAAAIFFALLQTIGLYVPSLLEARAELVLCTEDLRWVQVSAYLDTCTNMYLELLFLIDSLTPATRSLTFAAKAQFQCRVVEKYAQSCRLA
jgi:hypothetical protein